GGLLAERAALRALRFVTSESLSRLPTSDYTHGVTASLLLLTLALAPAAAADGAAPAAPTRVLVMDLEAVGIAADDVVAATRVVAAAAAEVTGVAVMSAAELRAMADLEVDRQNAGCGDDTSCVADIAGAMGAELVLFGSLSKL